MLPAQAVGPLALRARINQRVRAEIPLHCHGLSIPGLAKAWSWRHAAASACLCGTRAHLESQRSKQLASPNEKHQCSK